MDLSPPRGSFQFQLSTAHDHDQDRSDEMDFFAHKRDDHDRDQSKVTDNLASEADDHRDLSDFNVNVIYLI